MSVDIDTKVIGYFAYSSALEIVCNGDACVIAGSKKGMERYLASGESPLPTIKKTRFGEIMQGIHMGAAYAFDKEAYDRFSPLATRVGFALAGEDFQGPSTTDMRLLHVQLDSSPIGLLPLWQALKSPFVFDVSDTQRQELRGHEPGVPA